MASPPSSAIAGAAVSAIALAGVIADLARGLPLPTDSAQAALATCRRVSTVVAPQLVTLEDAAAIAGRLIATVQGLARDASPGDASAGLYAAAGATRDCVPASASPVLARAYGLARAMCVGVEAACLGEAFLCEARTAFGDRQAASAARDRITAALGGRRRPHRGGAWPARGLRAHHRGRPDLRPPGGSLRQPAAADPSRCSPLVPFDRAGVVALRRSEPSTRTGRP